MKNTAAAVTPPCAPATVRAVDPAALQALREMDADDSGFLFKLIEMFLTDMTERVAAMKTAMEAREVGSIKLTAHALKGSCGHFGAVALASLCRKLELIEPQDYARDGEATFRELVAEAHQVRVALLEERELASKHSSTTEENHRWGS